MTSSVQFSSFDLITQEMLHLQHRGGFHAGPAPLVGDGDDIITELTVTVNSISQTCFFWKGKEQIPFF